MNKMMMESKYTKEFVTFSTTEIMTMSMKDKVPSVAENKKAVLPKTGRTGKTRITGMSSQNMKKVRSLTTTPRLQRTRVRQMRGWTPTTTPRLQRTRARQMRG